MLDDSLKQCLGTSGGKLMKTKSEVKFGWNGPKVGPKLGFSPFSQVWDISLPLNCIG